MHLFDPNESKLSDASQARHEARREKRGRYFLKGPVEFDWILKNIPDPTSRAILVARAFMDMGGTSECVLGRKVWDCTGITGSDQRRRVLARLRKLNGDYRVIDRKGRPSVLEAVGTSTGA